MPNKFETIEAENEMRDLARVTSGEVDSLPYVPAWFWEVKVEKPSQPFQLTAADLAPGGFIHRD